MTDQTTPDAAPEAVVDPTGIDVPPVISEPQGSTTESTPEASSPSGAVPAPYTLMTIGKRHKARIAVGASAKFR